MYKKYNFSENFFKSIDTHEKAYVLGFIFADGYNREDLLELAQKKERIDILQKINSILESNVPIKEYTPGIFTLNLCSTKMCKDLTNLGAFKNKSLTLKFPTNISKEFMPSFILGYFDGDGCIWNGKRKKMTVKDSTKKSGYRERIVHNVKFTFTGVESFIIPLQEYLVSEKVVAKITKLNYSKAKNKNNSTKEVVCTMEYSGRKQIRNLYEFMYNKSSIFCDEKRKKFEEIFCAFDEKSSNETRLNAENSLES